MRFFGERARTEDPRAALGEARERLRAAAAAPPGPERHGALAAVLVRAGEIAQGVADAEADLAGADADGPGGRATLSALCGLARALHASHLAGGVAPAPAAEVLDAPLAAPLPAAIRTRHAEGFSQYAVYPETYAAAGAALRDADPTVVGVRSVGAALGAMVAAGAAATRVFTLRPRGHPFRRAVSLDPALKTALAVGAGRPYAVVDEGPGLSGSSFAAVVAALRALGVPPEAIHLFPSHLGPPGPEADGAIHALFARARRHHVAVEELLLGDGPLAVARLAADVLGPAEAVPEDVAGGAWRARLFPGPDTWPPSQGWRERRKYLLRASGRRWLARFVGLGEVGERAAARARALAAAGLSTAPAALRHGFLFEEWVEGAPLPVARPARAAVVAALRAHVTFVARSFPARDGEGASPGELLEVARDNAAELLGVPVPLDELAGPAREAASTARPVAIDGKLAAWEWLVRRDGRMVKADALDHHADHALVGCQDALWDVAGAAVEHELSGDEAEALALAVRAVSPGAPPRCLRFYRVAYAAFEGGRWALAALDPGLDGDEAARRRREAERYRGALRSALAGAPSGSRTT